MCGSKFFILFSTCVPVKGVRRSIVYDLQRETFDFIPNELYSILVKFSGNRISSVYEQFPKADHETIKEYFEFLLAKEYIYLFDKEEEVKYFPKIEYEWDYPSVISNSIIDIGEKDISIACYRRFLDQLESLGCYYIQIRNFGKLRDSLINEILFYIQELDISSVELIIPYEDQWPLEKYLELNSAFSKISNLIIFNCTESFISSMNFRDGAYNSNIVALQECIADHTFCGNIHASYFRVNVQSFMESQYYNSCLNRKLSLDVNGEVKNCPSLVESYGNIQDEELDIEEVVSFPGFQEKWNIAKDSISICRVCEFRYMCSDCRAFLENVFDKPIKCQYNPYTCEWEI